MRHSSQNSRYRARVSRESTLRKQEVAYFPATLVRFSLPAQTKTEWNRSFATDVATWNGAIPSGPSGRLAAIYLATKFVERGKYSQDPLGGDTASIRELLEPLGLSRSGGHRSGVERVREQLQRFIEMEILVSEREGEGYRVAADPSLALREYLETGRDPLRMPAGWKPDFERRIRQSAVPIDLRMVRALQKDCLGLDLYVYLTWKAFALQRSKEKKFTISFFYLQRQIGSDFASGSGRMFRQQVKAAIAKVLEMYPDLVVFVSNKGLVISASPPHVGPKAPKKRYPDKSPSPEVKDAPSVNHPGRGPPDPA